MLSRSLSDERQDLNHLQEGHQLRSACEIGTEHTHKQIHTHTITHTVTDNFCSIHFFKINQKKRENEGRLTGERERERGGREEWRETE